MEVEAQLSIPPAQGDQGALRAVAGPTPAGAGMTEVVRREPFPTAAGAPGEGGLTAAPAGLIGVPLLEVVGRRSGSRSSP